MILNIAALYRSRRDEGEPVTCPRCSRTLACVEHGEVVVRQKNRLYVKASDGRVGCLRCDVVVEVLTQETATP